MKVTFAGPAIAAAIAAAQTLNPSPRELLNASRSLQPAEIAAVLAASRDAVSGKTVRLSYQPGGPGPDVLMGPAGRPRFIRATSGGNSVSWIATSGSDAVRTETYDDLINFAHYTGQPARRCDGSAANGELVIDYEHRSSTNAWTATARTRTAMELFNPVFEMLEGAKALESGERKSIGDRPARALITPWTLHPGAMPGGPMPANMTQTLWIDVETLLPLRWELNLPGMPAYPLSFTYQPLDLHPPDEVRPPECIR